MSNDIKQVDSSGVAVLNLSRLRSGQRRLYELIVEHLDSDTMVTLDEAEQIWRSRVATYKIDGVPHRTDYFHNRTYDKNGVHNGWTAALVPMTQDEITERVLMWLTSNIGILVIRGYLKVIPMIEVTRPEVTTPVIQRLPTTQDDTTDVSRTPQGNPNNKKGTHNHE